MLERYKICSILLHKTSLKYGVDTRSHCMQNVALCGEDGSNPIAVSATCNPLLRFIANNLTIYKLIRIWLAYQAIYCLYIYIRKS